MVARSRPSCPSRSVSDWVARAWRTSATSVSFSPERTITTGGVSPRIARSTSPSSTRARASARSVTVRNTTWASRVRAAARRSDRKPSDAAGWSAVSVATSYFVGPSSRRSGRIIATLEPTKSRASTIQSERRRNDSRSSRPATRRVACSQVTRPPYPPLRGRARTGSALPRRSRRGACGDGCRRGRSRDRRGARAGAACHWHRPTRSPSRRRSRKGRRPRRRATNGSGSPPSTHGGRRATRRDRGGAT